MNKKSGSGTATFMMEMIMVVFFFILCASTCILVFARANSMSSLANDTNHGVVAAESVAEVWKAEGLAGMEQRFGVASGDIHASELQPGSLTVCWDRDWNVAAGSENAAYTAVLTWMTEDGLSEAQVVVSRTDDQVELYSLAVKKYLGSRE